MLSNSPLHNAVREMFPPCKERECESEYFLRTIIRERFLVHILCIKTFGTQETPNNSSLIYIWIGGKVPVSFLLEYVGRLDICNAATSYK